METYLITHRTQSQWSLLLPYPNLYCIEGTCGLTFSDASLRSLISGCSTRELARKLSRIKTHPIKHRTYSKLVEPPFSSLYSQSTTCTASKQLAGLYFPACQSKGKRFAYEKSCDFFFSDSEQIDYLWGVHSGHQVSNTELQEPIDETLWDMEILSIHPIISPLVQLSICSINLADSIYFTNLPLPS